MTTLLKIVILMAIVTWCTLMISSAIRARNWGSKGLVLALGNREIPPPPSALSGRADRTAANSLENFVLFAAIALVAQAANVANEKVTWGAEVFFWARVLYIPLYLFGVPYFRSIAWGIGVVGLGVMLTGMF